MSVQKYRKLSHNTKCRPTVMENIRLNMNRPLPFLQTNRSSKVTKIDKKVTTFLSSFTVNVGNVNPRKKTITVFICR